MLQLNILHFCYSVKDIWHYYEQFLTRLGLLEDRDDVAKEVGELLRALGVRVLWCDVLMHPQRPKRSEQQQHSTPGTVYPPPVAPHTCYTSTTARLSHTQAHAIHECEDLYAKCSNGTCRLTQIISGGVRTWWTETQ